MSTICPTCSNFGTIIVVNRVPYLQCDRCGRSGESVRYEIIEPIILMTLHGDGLFSRPLAREQIDLRQMYENLLNEPSMGTTKDVSCPRPRCRGEIVFAISPHTDRFVYGCREHRIIFDDTGKLM